MRVMCALSVPALLKPAEDTRVTGVRGIFLVDVWNWQGGSHLSSLVSDGAVCAHVLLAGKW